MTRVAVKERGRRPSVLRLLFLSFSIVAAGCVRTTQVEPFPVAYTQEDVDYFRAHPLMVPVEGVSPDKVPDSFNEPRADGRTHRATDILAPRETPVVAAIAGEVLRLSQNTAGGFTAYLLDEDRRYVYYYAHLAYYSQQITAGLKVPQGFIIGYVGTSGNAPPGTPHLHFQVMRYEPTRHDWWNGTPVDVRQFMTKTGKAAE